MIVSWRLSLFSCVFSLLGYLMSPEGKFALQDVLPKKHLEVTTKKTQKKMLRMPQPISLHAFVGTSVWIESA